MDLVISSRSSPKFASGVNDRRKAPYTDNMHLAYTRGKNMWIPCIVVVGFGEDFIGACEEHCSFLTAIFKQKGQPTWTHFLASLNVNLWEEKKASLKKKKKKYLLQFIFMPNLSVRLLTRT